MQRCYYAHFMGIYDTPAEQRDIETLSKLGFYVVNPNTEDIQIECGQWKMKKNFNYDEMFDAVFFQRIKMCDLLAFRALPDGTIPSGVLKEINYAKEIKIPVIELPCGISRRSLSVDATREYLHDMGER